MDITFLQEVPQGRLIAPELLDYSDEIVALLGRIGFEFQKGRVTIRIFGYSPLNLEGFEC